MWHGEVVQCNSYEGSWKRCCQSVLKTVLYSLAEYLSYDMSRTWRNGHTQLPLFADIPPGMSVRDAAMILFLYTMSIYGTDAFKVWGYETQSHGWLKPKVPSPIR